MIKYTDYDYYYHCQEIEGCWRKEIGESVRNISCPVFSVPRTNK